MAHVFKKQKKPCDWSEHMQGDILPPLPCVPPTPTPGLPHWEGNGQDEVPEQSGDNTKMHEEDAFSPPG